MFRSYTIRYLLAIFCITAGYSVLFISSYLNVAPDIIRCPFKILTTIPCPGCGMSRATLFLFKGDIVESLHSNLLCIPFTLCIAIAFIWMITDLIKKKETFTPFMHRAFSGYTKWIVFIVLLFNWGINIYHHI